MGSGIMRTVFGIPRVGNGPNPESGSNVGDGIMEAP